MRGKVETRNTGAGGCTLVKQARRCAAGASLELDGAEPSEPCMLGGSKRVSPLDSHF